MRIYVTEVTELRQADEALLQSKRELTRTQELLEAITRGTDVIIAAVDITFGTPISTRHIRKKSSV